MTQIPLEVLIKVCSKIPPFDSLDPTLPFPLLNTVGNGTRNMSLNKTYPVLSSVISDRVLLSAGLLLLLFFFRLVLTVMAEMPPTWGCRFSSEVPARARGRLPLTLLLLLLLGGETPAIKREYYITPFPFAAKQL